MVYVYGLSDVYYDSFYLSGIKKLFGGYTFNTSKFPKLNQNVFAVIVEQKEVSYKFIIDSRDANTFIDFELEWCDVYGKVNYNVETIPEKFRSKIRSIGPSFAIRNWNLLQTFYFGFTNYYKFYDQIPDKNNYKANFFRQYKRRSLDEYKPSTTKENYIFFSSSIWKSEPITNQKRAIFVNACKSFSTIFFEGGFAPRADGNNYEFINLTISKRYSMKQYLSNTKRSALVFNTPAVQAYHGWKLAEFLALGKAIISTKHLNELPEKLNHKEHLLYNDCDENLKSTIQSLLDDKELKFKLERNARLYFERNLAPKVVIEKLISNIL